MNTHTSRDLADSAALLSKEIRRSSVARYHHRLHALLLVARGMSCATAAQALGEPVRTVHHWVHVFLAEGLAGLAEDPRSGRPSRLDDTQRDHLRAVLGDSPRQAGLPTDAWDGGALSELIASEFGTRIGRRQCQRLLQELGSPLHRTRQARSPGGRSRTASR